MEIIKSKVCVIVPIALLIAACVSSTTTKKSDTTTAVVTKITRAGTLSSADWHVYNFPDEKICVPSSWRYQNQKDFLFLAAVDQKDTNAYFAVIKKMKKEEGGFEYLKRSYSFLKRNTDGKLLNYSVINTIYEDKNVLSCEFHLESDGKKYVVYAAIFEKNEYTFAITLKVPDGKNSFQQAYYNILYNFYYQAKLVFSEKDKIKDVRVINLDTL